MPSFDMVSEIDWQEVDNAVNQTSKEISQRFDFKGSESSILFDKKTQEVQIFSNAEAKLETVIDVLQSKAIKRGLDIKSFDISKVEFMGGQKVKQTIKIVMGIDKENAKEIIKQIKSSANKVQASIHDDKIRVTGKSRDDLQSVIQLIKTTDQKIPLQFNNFRD